MENIYTRERQYSDPFFKTFREMEEYDYMHGISALTHHSQFATMQPSKFRLGNSPVVEPHPARSHASKGGTRALRPGYLAAYTRSILPAPS